MSRSLPGLLALTCGLATVAPSLGCSAEEPPPDEAPLGVDGPVDLADVSILFPLPKSGEPDELLRATLDLGAGRVLLPGPLAGRFSLLQEEAATTYASLRVVSLRLEPCFRGAGARASDCRQQVRFVLQPVATSTAGEVSTLDAAAHVFYELRAETYVTLARALLDARPRSARAPLGVHPLLAKEGLSGPFARVLRTRIVSAATEGELVRATFMTVRGRGNEWQFGGFRVSGGGAVVEPLTIASSTASLQSLVLQTTQNTFLKSIAPPVADPEIAPLLDALTMLAASPEQVPSSAPARFTTPPRPPDSRTGS